ncbi:MAG: hypothetical protein ACPG4W_08125 [Flavobacteriales bacterium]
MIIRLISTEHFDKKELESALFLLDLGLDYFHIRSEFSYEVWSKLEQQIPESYRNQLVLHQHQHPKFLMHHKAKEKQIEHLGFHSCSVHQIEHLESYLPYYDHLFLSPMYDSISKSEYLGNQSIDVDFLSETQRKKCIALGGVRPEKFEELKQKGFSQVALKGWFWEQNSPLKTRWETLENLWQNRE